MYRRARAILGSDADAQEILQDIFITMLRKPQDFSGRESLTAFLYRATTNRCLNRLRDSRRRAELLTQHARSEISEQSPADRLAAERLLADLPEKLARVAVYYYIDELSHSEIAEILGCSRRSVGKLVEKVQARAKRSAA